MYIIMYELFCIFEINLVLFECFNRFFWLVEMGICWYGLFVVFCIMFDCGGLEFLVVFFNGWFMGIEIGVWDFCDV